MIFKQQPRRLPNTHTEKCKLKDKTDVREMVIVISIIIINQKVHTWGEIDEFELGFVDVAKCSEFEVEK